jgi:hypothetical protein
MSASGSPSRVAVHGDEVGVVAFSEQAAAGGLAAPGWWAVESGGLDRLQGGQARLDQQRQLAAVATPGAHQLGAAERDVGHIGDTETESGSGAGGRPGPASADRGGPADHHRSPAEQPSGQADQQRRGHVHARAGCGRVGLGGQFGGDGAQGAVPCQGALLFRLVQRLADRRTSSLGVTWPMPACSRTPL